MKTARVTVLVVVLFAMIGWATPAYAGGWASVRFTAPLPAAIAGEPWAIEVLVKQHDLTPIDVDPVVLTATPRTGGATVTATGTRGEEVGRYTLTAVFPTAGEWRWEIRPGPFPATAFPALTVHGPGEEALPDFSTVLTSGSCAVPGETIAQVSETGSPATREGGGSPDAVEVKMSHSLVDLAFDEIHATDHAVAVVDRDGARIACGDAGGEIVDGVLIMGLAPSASGGQSGIAMLEAAGGQTSITVYLVSAPPGGGGATAAIALTGETMEAWQFSPARLEVAVGTTVTWTNETVVAHTISSDDVDFDNSGYLDPGQSFSETFTKPGTYQYHCDPHPWMTGEIIVS